MFKSFIYLSFFSATCFSSLYCDQLPIEARYHVEGVGRTNEKIERVKCALFEEDYEEALTLVKNELGKSFTLDDLIELGKSIRHISFEAAAVATKNFIENPRENRDRLRIGLSKADFFKMAFFIEDEVPRLVQKNEFHFSTRKTKLLCPIEFEPKTEKVFIVLDEFKNSYLGEGMMKVVNKAIMYNRKCPQFVARAVQVRLNNNEKYMVEHAKGSKGIYKVIGCTARKVKGKFSHIIYSKLYRSGTVQDSMKNERFSLREKAKMMHELLQGLDTLHKRKVAHLDIKQNNCFVDIEKIAHKKRKITAVLADFGRSRNVRHGVVVGKHVQGNRLHNPPEAMYKERLQGDDYLATDIYALGCVLYRIFFDKVPSWQQLSYYPKAEHASQDFRYFVLANKIKSVTESRYQRLKHKKEQGAISIKEAMECLILKMVSANPKRRSTAQKLRAEMEHIIKRLEKE